MYTKKDLNFVAQLVLSEKKHKVVGIYMTVANINPRFYCRPDNVHLVALVYERHVKQFGFNKILEPLVAEIKVLEICGIEIQEQTIYDHFFAAPVII